MSADSASLRRAVETTAERASQAARRDPTAWRLADLPDGADLAAAEAFCRDVARKHYENFAVATRLVPPRLRQHLANVYAFARWSDDLADEAADPATAAADLAAWRRGLEECFAGRPVHPVFVALADTARRTGLTIEPFADLLDAFDEDRRFDAAGTVVRYPDRAVLVAYCRRSADPVGRIVLALEGCRDATLVAMSDSICTALQLVNFWQDVRRDRIAGRVYLPQDDMARHGVVEGMLDLPAAPPELRSLLRDEVAWARELFAAGAPLARLAPRALRPAIDMFLAGGRAVADAIERAGFDTLSRRPTVGRWTKLRLATQAWWRLTTSTNASSGGPRGSSR
jgi:squalene synthase HpnC